MNRFQDMVGKTYWHSSPDGKKDLVVVTSIEKCDTINKRKEWAWVTSIDWVENKQRILTGCALNVVLLFDPDKGEIPCWNFDLSEIK